MCEIPPKKWAQVAVNVVKRKTQHSAKGCARVEVEALKTTQNTLWISTASILYTSWVLSKRALLISSAGNKAQSQTSQPSRGYSFLSAGGGKHEFQDKRNV